MLAKINYCNYAMKSTVIREQIIVSRAFQISFYSSKDLHKPSFYPNILYQFQNADYRPKTMTITGWSNISTSYLLL